MSPQEAIDYFKGFPGVQGGVVCDHSGQIKASAMPKGFGETHALQLGRECGMLSQVLKLEWAGSNDLHVTSKGGATYICLTETSVFVLFLSKEANLSLIKISSKVVFQKFESKLSSGRPSRTGASSTVRQKKTQFLGGAQAGGAFGGGANHQSGPLSRPQSPARSKPKPPKPKPESDGIWG